MAGDTMKEPWESRIRYMVTLEDHIAFQIYHHRNSPTIRRWWTMEILALVAFSLVVGTIVSLTQKSPVPFLSSVAVSGLLFLIGKLFQYFWTERLIKKTCVADNAGLSPGSVTLDLTDTTIVKRGDDNTHSVAWSKIYAVETTDTHTFIYLGPTVAWIIPHNRIEEGDLTAFAERFVSRLNEESMS